MLRGWDLNPRPSGYEPDELPSCSTPRSGWLYAELIANCQEIPQEFLWTETIKVCRISF